MNAEDIVLATIGHEASVVVDESGYTSRVISLYTEPTARIVDHLGKERYVLIESLRLATEEETIKYWQKRAHEAEGKLRRS